MKVLLCSIYSPSGGDGVSNSTRQLVSALGKKGVDVIIFTTDWGWKADDIAKFGSDKLHIFKAVFNNNFDFSIGMIKRLYGICKEYDLIHFNSIYSVSTVLGAYASRKSNTPYVVSPQGNFIPSLKGQEGIRSAGKKMIFFNLFSRRVLINANKVVCNSEPEMESVRSRIKTDNLVCVRNGIDASDYSGALDSNIIEEKLGIKEGTPIFLFLGRLAEEKAIPFLLNVWRRVIQKMPDAVLAICGESDRGSHARIIKMVQKLDKTESVLMPGVVSGELKKALLQKSKCLFLPSYFESFGNVVLEALASGTPVIASRGTPWSVLEEKGFGRWLTWDVNLWEKAISDIVGDSSYQDKEFSERSRKWVTENYNWDNIADQYIKVYKDVIS